MTKIINLDNFTPRDYQLPVINAFERLRKRFLMLVLPRRSGKDFLIWNLVIRRALTEVGSYFYCLPTYRQAKLVIWDSITNDGKKFLDFIPRALIKRTNSQEMTIELRNGSIIRLIGSDSYDTSLVGTNPRLIVFSEYALSDDRAFQFVRPIVAANNGSIIIVSTPRGKNHMWKLYNIAKHSDDWFVYRKTIEETQHIPFSEIDRERREGILSEDLIQQEYYCSFDQGVEGAYYARYIEKMEKENRISTVPWEQSYQVYTSWDLGIRDSTCIIFFQIIGQIVIIIDAYSNNKQGLEHYIDIVRSKPYNYGGHIAPHDIRVREFTTGITRFEKARQLGINFEIADKLTIQDGIEAVRSLFPRLWIDKNNCSALITALENYRQEFDAKLKIYKARPLHDQFSHYADAMRYLALGMGKVGEGKSAEYFDKIYNEAFGNPHNNNFF